MTQTNESVKVTLSREDLDELARLVVESGYSRSSLIRGSVRKMLRAHKTSAIDPMEFTLDDYLA